MKIDEYLENVKRVRQRLRYPPNAVHDPGIDLTRKSSAYKGDIPHPDAPKKKLLGKETLDTPDIVLPVNFNHILYAVADHYKLSIESIKGDRRYRPEVMARRVIIHLGIKMLGRSLASIGRELNKDHTSILHARKKMHQNLLANPRLRGEVAAIEESLRAKHRHYIALPAIHESALEIGQREGLPIKAVSVLANRCGLSLDAAEAHLQD